MGNACTPTGNTNQSVYLRRNPSWGPKSQLSGRLSGANEITLDEAGDTPVMYPPSGGECLDCLACCKRAPPIDTSPPEKPFKCAVAVVRHGERLDQVDPKEWFSSELGRAYPFDCPLTAKGYRVAREVAEKLNSSGLEFALVVCSPYVRCVQTAAAMSEVLDLQLAIDAELSEIYGPRTHGQWKKPPPRRDLEEITKLVKLRGVPLSASPYLVRNESEDFFGTPPTWPETLEDARLRLVSRVEQYLARGLQMRRNFVLVTHGDCVAASLGLLLSSQGGSVRKIVTKIEYCAWATAERMVEPVDPVPLGLADDAAGWQLNYGNCNVSELDADSGGPWKGPFDPFPLPEEAQRLKDYEEEQLKTHQRKLLKKSSTTVLKSALHRQKSKELLGNMQPFDVQFGDLVPEQGNQISGPQDIVNHFSR